MFKTFFLKEIKYALRQPMVYIFLLLMALLVFGATSSDNIMIGGSVGNVKRNSPHIIANYTAIMSLFGLLFATAFYNNAALRDFKHKFNEIIFSTPISKSGYFFGRFFGALLLATIPMTGVFLGIILGSWIAPAMGWIDADRFQGLHLWTLISNYLLFILPNMFFAGAVIYALSSYFRNTIISFVGALSMIILYSISGSFLSDIDNETLASMLDMFGIRAYSTVTKYHTPMERNSLDLPFSGLLLWNRLVWIGLGILILLGSYFNFSFQPKQQKVKAKKNKDATTTPQWDKAPSFTQAISINSGWQHFKTFFALNFWNIVRNNTFKIQAIFGALMLISNSSGTFEYFGLKSYPLTYKMIDQLNDNSSLFIFIVLVFFSGELIWRDRDNKINEVIDATPHQSSISLMAKATSLVFAASILYFLLAIVAIFIQLFQGYTAIEIDLYLINFLYQELPGYIALAGLLLFVQVITNHKYIGYFISVLILFLSDFMFLMLDVQSNLINFMGAPSIRYSDMSGFGPGLTGALWFNTYWMLFGISSLFIAGLFWSRGKTTTIKGRLANGINSLSPVYKGALISCLVAFMGIGSWIYYNTQILNTYLTSDESELSIVEYEKKYKQHQDAPLPKITDIKYNIDLYPQERDLIVSADIKMANTTSEAIDSIHYTMIDEWETTINIPHANLVYESKDYRIYQLNKPLLPGQTLDVVIDSKYITQGFENNRGNTSIVENGSFFNNFAILPSLGYSSQGELSDKNKRKKHNLPEKERMPKLTANCTASCMKNYLTDGTADWVNIETVFSTSSDQVAIAPGSLLKQWEENGRNYYHYKVDHPSQYFYSFISARFEVAKRKWNNVDIEVYYDKKHDKNIDMMLDAVERSLAYYTTHFGPYMHKQARIIEFPRYSTFAQAFAGTMPYSESFGFVVDLEDEEQNNVIDAVIAHEMAHQWWAHQLIGANVQGGTMLSEAFSEYSSLMTMKQIADTPMKMREFNKYNHNRYLQGRGRELRKELPLYKVENQMYIHYGKGSVALYTLQDYIGEDTINKAMRNFLEEYRYAPPPYPTSLDFLRHLEPMVPDSLQYLVNDLFKDIVLYDNRLKEATIQSSDNGKYIVEFDIEARKIRADSLGQEQPLPLNDWIDIGLFADSEEKNLIYEQRVLVNKEKMKFTVEVDQKPYKAAVDPRQLLIDRVYSDNIIKVEEQ